MSALGARFGRAVVNTLRPILWGLLVGGPGLALMPDGPSMRAVVVAIFCAVALTSTPRDGRFLDRSDRDKYVRLALITVVTVLDTVWQGIGPNAFLVGCVFFVASKTLKARPGNVAAVAVAVAAMAFGGLLAHPHVALITGGGWTVAGAVRDVLRFAMLALLVVGARTDGERAANAERATEDAVRDERARIARELHDVVAHHVSVMTIQSEAAASGMPPGTKPAVAMRAAAESGRTALTELRRMLGVLRSTDGPRLETTSPQPGLEDLEQLVEEIRATGTHVDFDVEGDRPAAVSDGLGLSVYRIVQESLTNALKHAPGAPITVRLAYGPTTVRVDVESREPVGKVRSAGHGIVGMRERATLLDGALSAGPSLDGGGWLVRADLPLDPAAVPAT
jgi:signal transduction histidine kinase